MRLENKQQVVAGDCGTTNPRGVGGSSCVFRESPNEVAPDWGQQAGSKGPVVISPRLPTTEVRGKRHTLSPHIWAPRTTEPHTERPPEERSCLAEPRGQWRPGARLPPRWPVSPDTGGRCPSWKPLAADGQWFSGAERVHVSRLTPSRDPPARP